MADSGIFVNNKNMSFEDFGEDSRIFDIDMSASKEKDRLKSDGWAVLKDGLTNSLLYKEENGISCFQRVISAGDVDVNRMFKEDIPFCKQYMLDNSIDKSYFEYLPVILVLKNTKTTRRGGIRKVNIKENAAKVVGFNSSRLSVYDEAPDDVCPVCFMIRANGHCFCDAIAF
jgi:hypothetical protein